MHLQQQLNLRWFPHQQIFRDYSASAVWKTLIWIALLEPMDRFTVGDDFSSIHANSGHSSSSSESERSDTELWSLLDAYLYILLIESWMAMLCRHITFNYFNSGRYSGCLPGLPDPACWRSHSRSGNTVDSRLSQTYWVKPRFYLGMFGFVLFET